MFKPVASAFGLRNILIFSSILIVIPRWDICSWDCIEPGWSWWIYFQYAIVSPLTLWVFPAVRQSNRTRCLRNYKVRRYVLFGVRCLAQAPPDWIGSVVCWCLGETKFPDHPSLPYLLMQYWQVSPILILLSHQGILLGRWGGRSGLARNIASAVQDDADEEVAWVNILYFEISIKHYTKKKSSSSPTRLRMFPPEEDQNTCRSPRSAFGLYGGTFICTWMTDLFPVLVLLRFSVFPSTLFDLSSVLLKSVVTPPKLWSYWAWLPSVSSPPSCIIKLFPGRSVMWWSHPYHSGGTFEGSISEYQGRSCARPIDDDCIGTLVRNNDFRCDPPTKSPIRISFMHQLLEG